MRLIVLGCFLLAISNMQNNKLQSDSVFNTSDLSLSAALLVSKKVQFVGLQRVSPYKFEFHFSPLDICRQLQNDYLNGNFTVQARDISDAVKHLKSLMKTK